MSVGLRLGRHTSVRRHWGQLWGQQPKATPRNLCEFDYLRPQCGCRCATIPPPPVSGRSRRGPIIAPPHRNRRAACASSRVRSRRPRVGSSAAHGTYGPEGCGRLWRRISWLQASTGPQGTRRFCEFFPRSGLSATATACRRARRWPADQLEPRQATSLPAPCSWRRRSILEARRVTAPISLSCDTFWVEGEVSDRDFEKGESV